MFGTSGRLGRVLGVCEVGKNYVMFKVEGKSGVPEGDVRMWGIVVSALPIDFQLSWTQHFIMCYLCIFLWSLVKFADKEHIEEGMESDTTKVGEDSELEFSELTQSTEMREAEYSAESEDSEYIQGHIAVYQDFFYMPFPIPSSIFHILSSAL